MSATMRRKLIVAGRVLVSLGLLAFLLLGADLGALAGVWRNASVPLLLLVLALQIGGVFISSLKWWLLLRASEQHVSYGWTVRAYFIGTFFSNFLPTMVGGDAVRIFQLHQRTGRTSDAVASVFVERLTGFLALTFIGAISLGLSLHVFENASQLLWAVMWCIAVAGLGLVLAFFAPVVIGLLTRLHVPNVANWRGKLGSMADTLRGFYAYHGTLALAVALSFCYQLSWIATNYAAARALRLDLPFSFVALMVPLSDIVGLVPIFFNSLGAREGTYVLLLGLIGFAAEAAVALSLLIFMVRLVVSLIGGLLYLLGGLTGVRRSLAEEMQVVQRSRLAEKR